MLSPTLDIYVVWHPGDQVQGSRIVDVLLDHFHGTPYTGLIGGSVEVYARSAPWAMSSDAPRPMPFQESIPRGLPAPRFVAIVPVLGGRLARAVENPSSGWHGYLDGMLASAAQADNVGIFPIRLPRWKSNGQLGELLGGLQALPPSSIDDGGVLCREIAQQVTQLICDPFVDRLTVFISHTKRRSPDEESNDVDELLQRVRARIAATHLDSFLDEADLQPGTTDWTSKLQEAAESNIMLALRTDLYPRRKWCQQEFLAAKRADVPIVTLSAVRCNSERGSFLMDHVPVVGYQDCDEIARDRSIDKALNLLVDRALSRSLWKVQEQYLDDLGIDWAPHEAPELTTVVTWLIDYTPNADTNGLLTIMHPDPPLGPDEEKLIKQLFTLVDPSATVDIVTPRIYADRGGRGL